MFSFLSRSSTHTQALPPPVIANGFILNPFAHVLISHNTHNIHFEINTTPFFQHLHNLTQLYQNLTQHVDDHRYTMFNIPELETVSVRIKDIIERASYNLLTILQTSPTPNNCTSVHNYRKRSVDVLPNSGLFPELGTALSWLTGTLSSQAKKYINLNYNNIVALQKSNKDMISVLNHTALFNRKSAIQMDKLNAKMITVTNQLTILENKQAILNSISSVFQSLQLAAQAVERQIDNLISLIQWAQIGQLDHQILRGFYYRNILSVLDAQTKTTKSLKFILKHAAEISVEVCHAHIWLFLTIPSLSPHPHTLYHFYNIPIRKKGLLYELPFNPKAVSWSTDRLFQFTEDELNLCKVARHIRVCKTPSSVTPLQVSCIFKLIKNISNDCTTVQIDKADDQIFFEYNHLVYDIHSNLPKVTDIQCPKQHTTKGLTGSGVIFVPPLCQLRLNSVLFTNKMTRSHKFEVLPKFYNEKSFVYPLIQDTSIAPNTATLVYSEEEYNSDIKKLTMASDILGDMKLTLEGDFMLFWCKLICGNICGIVLLLLVSNFLSKLFFTAFQTMF